MWPPHHKGDLAVFHIPLNGRKLLVLQRWSHHVRYIPFKKRQIWISISPKPMPAQQEKINH